MALPARQGDVPAPREESLEVHPAGEEFLPAVAVLLMNRPAHGAGALPCPAPPWPDGRPRPVSPDRGRARLGPAWGCCITPAHTGGETGGAGALWLPWEIPAKLQRSSLCLLLKGARSSGRGRFSLWSRKKAAEVLFRLTWSTER